MTIDVTLLTQCLSTTNIPEIYGYFKTVKNDSNCRTIKYSVDLHNRLACERLIRLIHSMFVDISILNGNNSTHDLGNLKERITKISNNDVWETFASTTDLKMQLSRLFLEIIPIHDNLTKSPQNNNIRSFFQKNGVDASDFSSWLLNYRIKHIHDGEYSKSRNILLASLSLGSKIFSNAYTSKGLLLLQEYCHLITKAEIFGSIKNIKQYYNKSEIEKLFSNVTSSSITVLEEFDKHVKYNNFCNYSEFITLFKEAIKDHAFMESIEKSIKNSQAFFQAIYLDRIRLSKMFREAVLKNELHLVSYILDLKCNGKSCVNINNKENDRTALHDASKQNYNEMIHLLCNHGADVQALDEYGHDPLYYIRQDHGSSREAFSVCEKKQQSIIAKTKEFCEKIKNILQDKTQLKDEKNDLTRLIHDGVDINNVIKISNVNINYPLWFAYQAKGKKKIELMKLFIENGADIYKKNKIEEQILPLACKQGDIEAIKLILNHDLNALFYSLNEHKNSLFFIAFKNNKNNVLKMLFNYREKYYNHVKKVFKEALISCDNIEKKIKHHASIDQYFTRLSLNNDIAKELSKIKSLILFIKNIQFELPNGKKNDFFKLNKTYDSVVLKQSTGVAVNVKDVSTFVQSISSLKNYFYPSNLSKSNFGGKEKSKLKLLYDEAIENGNWAAVVLTAMALQSFVNDEGCFYKNPLLLPQNKPDQSIERSVKGNLIETFLQSVKDNNLKQVSALLDSQLYTHSMLNHIDENGNTAIHNAALSNSEAMIYLLCHYGCNLNQSNQQELAPYYCAKSKESKSALNICDKQFLDDYTFEFREKIKLIINKSEDITPTEKRDITYLIQHGAEIDTCINDPFNNYLNSYASPLCWTLFYQKIELVKLLLQQGADHSLNVKNKEFRNTFKNNSIDFPLLIPLENENIKINLIELLINYGANIYQENQEGDWILSRACYKGNVDVIKLVLKKDPSAAFKLSKNKNIFSNIVKLKNKTAVISAIVDCYKKYFDYIFNVFETTMKSYKNIQEKIQNDKSNIFEKNLFSGLLGNVHRNFKQLFLLIEKCLDQAPNHFNQKVNSLKDDYEYISLKMTSKILPKKQELKNLYQSTSQLFSDFFSHQQSIVKTILQRIYCLAISNKDIEMVSIIYAINPFLPNTTISIDERFVWWPLLTSETKRQNAKSAMLINMFIPNPFLTRKLTEKGITNDELAMIQNSFQISRYIILLTLYCKFNGFTLSHLQNISELFFKCAKENLNALSSFISPDCDASGKKSFIKVIYTNKEPLKQYFYKICLDEKFITMFREAVSKGYLTFVHALLDLNVYEKHYVDINNTSSWYQDTALHNAAARDDVDMINLLCDHGADVNKKNKDDETPLHYASKKIVLMQ